MVAGDVAADPHPADAERAVRYYALRWLVERDHFTMKSGCQVERLQLQTAERLDRAVATYSAVAWRLLWLTYEARRHPEQSCERVLPREEWEVLCRATGGATAAPRRSATRCGGSPGWGDSWAARATGSRG